MKLPMKVTAPRYYPITLFVYLCDTCGGLYLVGRDPAELCIRCHAEMCPKCFRQYNMLCDGCQGKA